MAVFEKRVLTDTVEIRATPEKIFAFLTGIVDDAGYRAWHDKDHVAYLRCESICYNGINPGS
jgi:hypothetical protein